MQKKVLVTGVNGFVGHHLTKELRSAGVNVIGLGYDSEATQQNQSLLESYISCNLTSMDDVRKVSFEGVDAVIHLAGLANVGQSFAEPARFVGDNAAMAVHLMQHALEQKANTRFVVISSGAVYESKQPLPIGEGGVLSHGSPYSVSKLTVEMMCDYYRSRGLETIVMRPFNHFGPGQMPGFIIPDLTTKLKEFMATGKEIVVGDLSTGRDYTDVRDVAKAYILVATSDSAPQQAVYNVCSGVSRKGSDLFAAIANALGLAETPTPTVDQALLRPNDAKDIFGDNSRIKNEFSWGPTISFEQTVRDTVAALE